MPWFFRESAHNRKKQTPTRCDDVTTRAEKWQRFRVGSPPPRREVAHFVYIGDLSRPWNSGSEAASVIISSFLTNENRRFDHTGYSAVRAGKSWEKYLKALELYKVSQPIVQGLVRLVVRGPLNYCTGIGKLKTTMKCGQYFHCFLYLGCLLVD